ncbi:MAG: ABC transporter permease [Bryobacteraceae bacterium]
MGPVFQKAGQGSYLQFVAPGIIAITVLFSSVFSGMGLLWDRQFGFLKEALVAPVPRIQIILGRTLRAASVAVVQGLLVVVVCFTAGFRIVSLANVPLPVLLMALIASLFSHGELVSAPYCKHSGFSTDNELPGNADILFIGRPVSAQ